MIRLYSGDGMQTKFSILLSIYLLTLLGILILFNVYSLLLNESNHTGLPLTSLSYFYLITLVVNLILLIIVKFKKLPVGNTSLIYYLVILSILAIVNIAAFEKFNVMMEYETWQKKGMPEKPLNLFSR